VIDRPAAPRDTENPLAPSALSRSAAVDEALRLTVAVPDPFAPVSVMVAGPVRPRFVEPVDRSMPPEALLTVAWAATSPRIATVCAAPPLTARVMLPLANGVDDTALVPLSVVAWALELPRTVTVFDVVTLAALVLDTVTAPPVKVAALSGVPPFSVVALALELPRMLRVTPLIVT
jgi:hypothetical protein